MIGCGNVGISVLGEISKSLWEPPFGFHRDVISIAVFVGADGIETPVSAQSWMKR
jgi:hypothetical protein